MLTPEDDYYPAPYAFMPQRDNAGRSTAGFLVFTNMVPWQDGFGSPQGQHDSDMRLHAQARRYMEKKSKFDHPHVGTVEKFMSSLKLNEGDYAAFTPDGCYPTMDEVCQSLGKCISFQLSYSFRSFSTPAAICITIKTEDKAVTISCEFMGWQVPQNWRLKREEFTKHRMTNKIPRLDLAEWDRTRKSKRKCSGDTNDDNASEGIKRVDEAEEKKDPDPR